MDAMIDDNNKAMRVCADYKDQQTQQ
jgi:hypothetical protein